MDSTDHESRQQLRQVGHNSPSSPGAAYRGPDRRDRRQPRTETVRRVRPPRKRTHLEDRRPPRRHVRRPVSRQVRVRAGFPFRSSRSATTPSIRSSKRSTIPAEASTSRQSVLDETTAHGTRPDEPRERTRPSRRRPGHRVPGSSAAGSRLAGTEPRRPLRIHRVCRLPGRQVDAARGKERAHPLRARLAIHVRVRSRHPIERTNDLPPCSARSHKKPSKISFDAAVCTRAVVSTRPGQRGGLHLITHSKTSDAA